MTLPEGRAARPIALATTVAAAACVLGAVATIVLPPMFPCQDAPGHLTDVRVSQDPALFAEWLKTGFAPASLGFRAPAALVARFVSAIAAAKIVLLVYLAGLVWAFDGIAKRRGGMRPVAIAAAAAVFVGWYYAMGFFNFLGALTFGSIGLRLWAEAEERPVRRFGAALAFVLCALSHVVTGGMFLVQAWVADALARVPLRTLVLRGLTLVPAGLVAVGVSWLAFEAHAELGAVGRIGTLDPPFAVTLRDLFATALVGFSRTGYAAAAVLLVGLLVGLASERGASEAAWQRRANHLLGLAWTALFLAVPMNALGWHYASPRILFFAYVLPAALVPAGRWTRAWAPVAAVACAATTIGGLPLALAEGRQIAATVETFGDEPVGRTFIVNHHPEGHYTVAPWARPNVGTGRYATWNGGVDPGLFANNPVREPVTFARPMNEMFPPTEDLYAVVTEDCRRDPDCSSEAAEIGRADCTAATAVHWDSVTLVETPAVFVERMMARGFVPQAPGVLRPRPSTLRYSPPAESWAQAAAAGDGRLVTQVAYPGTCGIFETIAVDVAAVPAAGPTIQVSPLPAGPVTLRMFVDLDGDRQPGPGDPVVVSARTVRLPPGELTVVAD